MSEHKLNLKLDRKPINMRQFWLKLWKLISASHRQIISLFVLILASEGFQFVGPYLLKRIIDLMANFKAEHARNIIILVIFILVADLVANLINYFADKRIFVITVEVEKWLI